MEAFGPRPRVTLVTLAAAALVGSCADSAVAPPMVVGEPVLEDLELEERGLAARSAGPAKVGDFSLTFYYVIGEDEVGGGRKNTSNIDGMSDSDAILAATTPMPQVALYDRSCEPIAQVTRSFAMQLQMQGTGRLRDGRTVNIWGACGCERSPCFKVTGQKWGTAGNGRPLSPFRTVAVDPSVVALGSLLYIPELEGVMMPGSAPWGGFRHDGCVVADDTGGGIIGNKVDFFVGRRAHYHSLSRRGGSHGWAKHVDVFDGASRCTRSGGKVTRSVAAL
jgi:3D (Asp-Asp-Asp) domain-containing protein